MFLYYKHCRNSNSQNKRKSEIILQFIINKYLYVFNYILISLCRFSFYIAFELLQNNRMLLVKRAINHNIENKKERESR